MHLQWLIQSSPEIETTKTVTGKTGTLHEITVKDATGIFFYAQLFNKYVGVINTFLAIRSFLHHLSETIMDINARPVYYSAATSQHTDQRLTWFARGGLIIGVLTSHGLGLLLTMSWRTTGLAHLTYLDYMAIMVPTQTVVGIVLASIVQAYNEKDEALKLQPDLKQRKEIEYDEKKGARGDGERRFTSEAL